MSPTNRRSATAAARNGLWSSTQARFPGRAVVDHGTTQASAARVVHGRRSAPSGPATVWPTTAAPPCTSTVTPANIAPETNWPGEISRRSPGSILKARSTARPVSSTTVTRPSVGEADIPTTSTVRSSIPSSSAVGPAQNQRAVEEPSRVVAARASGRASAPITSTGPDESAAAVTVMAASTRMAGPRVAIIGSPPAAVVASSPGTCEPNWPAAPTRRPVPTGSGDAGRAPHRRPLTSPCSRQPP